MPISLTLNTSAVSMGGGATAAAGTGERHDITIGGSWAIGDKITLLLQDSITGTQVLIGAGNVTGITPTFAFTFNDKVYVLAGDTVYFSALGAPTIFNALDGSGNGFVKFTDHYANPESMVAIAAFQGRLCFISRQGVQIWTCPANPAQWHLEQIFEFVGSRSKLSPKTAGDFEVYFLDETGVRSLRVRDNTLNAFSEDLGSPIDELIQAALIASSDTQKDAACGIVEPSSKRYWLFLKDVIYVFSNFPSSKITAWSKYAPTFNLTGAQTAFTPEKFVVYKGQVYCRAGDYFFLYGGSDNNTYDACVASWETPYLDAKTPANIKASKGIDLIASGAWTITAGMDPVSAIVNTILSMTGSTYDQGVVPFSERGTHVKFGGQTSGSTAAKVGALTWLYELGNEQ